MARQYVCDRCGKIIRDFTTRENVIWIFDKNEHTSHTSTTKGKYIDLCEDCQNVLQSFCRVFMKESKSL